MTFINGRQARFFDFKEKDSFPKEIVEKGGSGWMVLFNGEDWTNKGVFYASEADGIMILYATNAEGTYLLNKEDGTIKEEPPKKGRVRILEVGDEIDHVENIWDLKR